MYGEREGDGREHGGLCMEEYKKEREKGEGKENNAKLKTNGEPKERAFWSEREAQNPAAATTQRS